jgi:hypothetical protein
VRTRCGQRARESGVEGLFGAEGVVTTIIQHAGIIFQLHHDDRMFADIKLANVLHDRGERTDVGVPGVNHRCQQSDSHSDAILTNLNKICPPEARPTSVP